MNFDLGLAKKIPNLKFHYIHYHFREPHSHSGGYIVLQLTDKLSLTQKYTQRKKNKLEKKKKAA